MPDETLGPLFEAPSEFAILPIVINCLAICSILVALFALVRGRVLSDRLFSGAYSVALLMLPVFAYVLGDVFLLEESKQAEFCGSCHTAMSPLFESLESDTDTLATIHYQRGAVDRGEACYQCHSGFGTYGTLNAKLSGIKHMVSTLTGDYEYPLELHGKFDLASCLSCHATSVSFRAEGAHRDPDLQRQLLAGDLSCADSCHPPAHPPEALRGAPTQ